MQMSAAPIVSASSPYGRARDTFQSAKTSSIGRSPSLNCSRPDRMSSLIINAKKKKAYPRQIIIIVIILIMTPPQMKSTLTFRRTATT